MITTYQVTATSPSSGQRSILTTDKIAADKFLLNGVFQSEVELTYTKKKMTQEEFDKEKKIHDLMYVGIY